MVGGAGFLSHHLADDSRNRATYFFFLGLTVARFLESSVNPSRVNPPGVTKKSSGRPGVVVVTGRQKKEIITSGR